VVPINTVPESQTQGGQNETGLEPDVVTCAAAPDMPGFASAPEDEDSIGVRGREPSSRP
jgi:hypothetical protein